VREFFGFKSANIDDATAMMMGQAELDWFMLAISRAVARSAQLVQQYMEPMKGARITGTRDVVTATADEVRGQYDFRVSFNVKSLNAEWMKEHLGFLKDVIMPLDRRGDMNTLPALESALNMWDPRMRDLSLPESREAAQRQTVDAARNALNDIFLGGSPEVTEGMDFGGMAEVIAQEIARSPQRQRMILGGQQAHLVLSAFVNGLVSNNKQHGGENAQIGRTLTKDPLQQPSAAEALLQELQALPEGVSLFAMRQQQTAQPLSQPSR
jgi:hypothetical protein